MTNKTFERALLGSTAILVGAAGGVAAQDFSGLYSGVSLSFANGDLDFVGVDYSIGGNSGGLFAGYNFVQGDWVYGVELGWTGGFDVDDAYGDTSVNNIVDVRARVGRLFGNTMVYGALGYWQGDLLIAEDFFCCPSDWEYDADGMSFGIGFETAMGPKSFLGAEIMRRNIDVSGGSGIYTASDYTDGGDLTTATIRAGFRF